MEYDNKRLCDISTRVLKISSANVPDPRQASAKKKKKSKLSVMREEKENASRAILFSDLHLDLIACIRSLCYWLRKAKLSTTKAFKEGKSMTHYRFQLYVTTFLPYTCVGRQC